MTELVHRDALDVLKDLPEFCASRLNTTGQPCILKRGVKGFWPTHHNLDVRLFNEQLAVTDAQVQAMEFGSIAGFDTPGADPKNWPDTKPLAPVAYDAALTAKWRAAIADGSWADIARR